MQWLRVLKLRACPRWNKEPVLFLQHQGCQIAVQEHQRGARDVVHQAVVLGSIRNGNDEI